MYTVSKQNILCSKTKLELRLIWNAVYPVNIAHQSITQTNAFIDKKENTQHYVIFSENNNLLGWSFTFLRYNEPWFSILVHPSMQKKGFGTLLLKAMKKDNFILNGWMVNGCNYLKKDGSFYVPPEPFYIKSNFKIIKDCIFNGDRLNAVKVTWKKD